MVNNRYTVLVVLCLLFSLSLPLLAQERGTDERVRVISEIEQSTILIGEQTNLKIRVVYPNDATAALVLPKDTLMNGVEIVRTDLIDSLSVNDKLRELVYNVTITSFDSATYHLSNINALVGGKLYSPSETPSLMVNTMPVDLDNPDKYADIKDQWKPKFVWQDYLLYLYIFLGLVLLAVGIYYLIRYLKKRKDISEIDDVEDVYMDPYEEALQGIINLKSKELWEKNQIKEYYTELTEIVRKYLWRVYGISTAEKTSDEILEQFRTVIGRDRMYQELTKILHTADMAKFAKYQPSSDDNIRLLFITQEFIEEHKPHIETESEQKGGANV
ncbi:hypothetical protein QYZ87_08870 [Porphyromonadaceae bacterium W3.11]|nr:hypothetical protein [Porphyromonadaceae bacterium W3.11]